MRAPFPRRARLGRQRAAKAGMIRSAKRAKRFGALERASRRPDRDSGPARQNMEMEMEDLLAARRLVELLNDDAFGLHASHDRMRHGLHRRRQAGEVGGGDVEQIAGGDPWDHQRMAVGARHHVEEGERNLVLVNLGAGGLAAQDLGEDVVGIIGRRRQSFLPASRLYRLRPVGTGRDSHNARWCARPPTFRASDSRRLRARAARRRIHAPNR